MHASRSQIGAFAPFSNPKPSVNVGYSPTLSKSLFGHLGPIEGASRPKANGVGYLRVSSLDQNEVRQLEGLALDKTFTDKASGKDAKRPQ
jgi:hypothetical protein